MNLATASVGAKFNEKNHKNDVSGTLKDSPRSLSDLKFSVSPRSQDSDNEILDLDVYDLTDDDESWLYSCPGGKVTSTDITAWLKKDADNLDPKTRRALAVKLESFLRRKNSAGTISNDSCDSDRRPNALKETSVSLQAGNSTKTDQNLVSKHSNGRHNQNHVSDETNKEIHVNKHSDLNPDIKDIQLLASMQEQDLRHCLQQVYLNNTRRRMTPEQQDRLGTSPKNFSSPAASFSAGTSPKDLSATYVKPSLGRHSDAHSVYATPKSLPSKPTVSRKISSPLDLKKTQKLAFLPAEKHVGLRKSLPNLAASRSGEFSLPTTNDCSSEKGSCGDIPTGLSPSQSSNRVANGVRSRLPTPSRMNTPSTLTRSGIPVPRSRAKSPAPKMSLQTRLVDRYNPWIDGCI